MKINAIDKKGNLKEYDVILTYHSDKFDKDYIVYTDNTYDEDNKLRIYAALYNPLTNEFLGYVENKEEWRDIIKLLDNVLLK